MAERREVQTLTTTAAGVVGPEHVRVATTNAEPGAGVPPLVLIEPPDAERAAAVLAWASRDRIPIAIQGGGTKAAWGPPLEPVDLVLSTRRLDSVVEHRLGDLTATVQAGATLESVNRALNAHNQWIPLDPVWAQRATIGGIVATNDSGPRRHRYGSPRDLIIGVTLARTDGRLAKAGGIVVKNVAGYDLARLLTGSFGTLALIIDATFKLAPVAPSSFTVIVGAETVAALGNVLADLAAGQTAPSAVELEIPPGRLLIRFQAPDHAARQQASEMATQASKHGTSVEIVEGGGERELWRDYERHPWEKSGCVAKLSLLPTRIVSIAEWLQETLPETKWELIGRAGLGVLLLRLDANEDEVEQYLIELQTQFARGELFMSVLRASPTLRRRLAAREAQTNALSLMQAIKRQFDPAGILNPGRGPGGR
jgi:glycolate oxidase FAD binding subunit